MKTFGDISDRQNIAFGNSENGCLWHFQNTDNQYRYNYKTTPNFTGKELDAETGYSYFGARYLDHGLMTSWLSVDPMADKYPSISPYAYCAWNPLKLVDPDGEEIDLSALSEENQNRLLACLSQLTGLSLYIDNGKLKYYKALNQGLFSTKAQSDLKGAIDEKNFSIVVAESNYDFCNRETGKLSLYNDDYTSCSEIPYNAIIGLDFLSDQDDFSTYGLSMSFMHELLHGFYNYEDPTEDENKSTFYDISKNEIQIKRRIEQTASYKRGNSVVGRVNEYRRELGWDIRMTYAEHEREGLPFQRPNGTIYWIKKNSSVPKL